MSSVKQLEAVKTWANHVNTRDEQAKRADYDIVDKVANVPGDMYNWLQLKVGSRQAGGMNVGNGEVAYPAPAVQQLHKDYQANPNDERLRQEWLDAVNSGRINLMRGR